MALGGSSDALMSESRGGREEHVRPSPVLRTHRHDGGALECLCRAVAARRSPNRCTCAADCFSRGTMQTVGDE